MVQARVQACCSLRSDRTRKTSGGNSLSVSSVTIRNTRKNRRRQGKEMVAYFCSCGSRPHKCEVSTKRSCSVEPSYFTPQTSFEVEPLVITPKASFDVGPLICTPITSFDVSRGRDFADSLAKGRKQR